MGQVQLNIFALLVLEKESDIARAVTKTDSTVCEWVSKWNCNGQLCPRNEDEACLFSMLFLIFFLYFSLSLSISLSLFLFSFLFFSFPLSFYLSLLLIIFCFLFLSLFLFSAFSVSHLIKLSLFSLPGVDEILLR